MILKRNDTSALSYRCLIGIIFLLSVHYSPLRAQTAVEQTDDGIETAKQVMLAYTNGNRALQNGRIEQAILFFAKTVQLQPRNPQFRYRLASAYGQADQRLGQWFQLRQAVRLDPAFEAAREDFLKMWWVAFNKGVLDIGTSMDDVKTALGDPDIVVTGDENERYVLWRYAFMELLFVDGRLDNTLDSRRPRGAGGAAQVAISLALDDLDWQLKRQHIGLRGDLIEYLPARAGSYAQQLSIEQKLDLPAGHDLRELMQQVQNKVQQSATTQWQTLEDKEDNVIFEWRDSGASPRHEITRILSKNDFVYRLTYTAYLADLDADQRSRWLEKLTQAKILTDAEN